MSDTLYVGEVVSLEYTLDFDGATPTVELTLTAPDGTVTTPPVAAPTGSTWTVSFVPGQAGTWRFVWEASDSKVDIEVGTFDVASIPVGEPTLEAFATPEQLSRRLGRAAFTGAEREQVQELLADATAHLRAVIGWQVSPPATVTFRTRPGYGTAFPLPGAPITAITGVTSAGVPLAVGAYELVDGSVEFTGSHPRGAVVTYTVGYPTPPRDLVSWTCVLTSQALSALEELGALGGGGVSSIAIDDFRKSWADGGDGAGFVLPSRVEEKLRERYGSGGVFVSGA